MYHGGVVDVEGSAGYPPGFRVRPGLSVNLTEAFGRGLRPSEQAVFGHLMVYTYHDPKRGRLRPFLQTQAVIAAKLGYHPVTISRAVCALERRGLIRIKRRQRRCSLIAWSRWLYRALVKVHRAVKHWGISKHVARCWERPGGMRRLLAEFGGRPRWTPTKPPDPPRHDVPFTREERTRLAETLRRVEAMVARCRSRSQSSGAATGSGSIHYTSTTPTWVSSAEPRAVEVPMSAQTVMERTARRNLLREQAAALLRQERERA